MKNINELLQEIKMLHSAAEQDLAASRNNIRVEMLGKIWDEYALLCHKVFMSISKDETYIITLDSASKVISEGKSMWVRDTDILCGKENDSGFYGYTLHTIQSIELKSLKGLCTFECGCKLDMLQYGYNTLRQTHFCEAHSDRGSGVVLYPFEYKGSLIGILTNSRSGYVEIQEAK